MNTAVTEAQTQTPEYDRMINSMAQTVEPLVDMGVDNAQTLVMRVIRLFKAAKVEHPRPFNHMNHATTDYLNSTPKKERTAKDLAEAMLTSPNLSEWPS